MQTFTDLGDAVRFLAAAIESDDRRILAQACREAPPEEWVLKRLRECNDAAPLVELYAGWMFPSDACEFKLGGHDKELGHIHIDFVRVDNGWQIKRIWMCR